MIDSLKGGKPLAKTKKLHKIKAMVQNEGDEEPTADQDIWASLIGNEFRHKWGCDNLHQRELVKCELENHNGVGIKMDETDLQDSLGDLKKVWTLDGFGLCRFIF